MRILKSHPILGLVNSYVIDSPQPSNISYAWNGGSLLGLCLVTQLATGIFLAMHYIASADLAFISVESIMRDVNSGWMIRYIHANTASLFFAIIYLHIARGMWYGSYGRPRTLVWSIGVIILVLLIITAFLGYVLVYGQMSLWGATVITNLVSAVPWIGDATRDLIWGGFSVGDPTVTRFFTFHYTAAFVLAAVAAMHMLALHEHGFIILGPKLLLTELMCNYLYFKQSLMSCYTLAFIIPNTRAIKRIGPHNEDITSILVGGLLGDVGAERNMNGGVRFRFKQSHVHKEYLFYLYNYLLERGYCNSTLPVEKLYKEKRFLFKDQRYYKFDTFSFTNLIWLYKSFYNHNKVKVIPQNIEELLTPLALAIWIMDDGARHGSGLRLHTNCFTLEEVNLLNKALNNKFSLICSIHINKTKHVIYISSKSMKHLVSLVKPYMHDSMLYKLAGYLRHS